jgi:hypothetical protein
LQVPPEVSGGTFVLSEDSMKRYKALHAFAVTAALLLTSACSWAQAPEVGRIPTVTRTVKLFSGLEIQLAENLRGGKKQEAEALLEDDFELRPANTPGLATPRADWLGATVGKYALPPRTEQMAVHDLGSVAVVSFLQPASENEARDRGRDLFVVDVWKRSGDTWKLAVRYAGPAGSASTSIPGVGNPAVLPKRY